MPLSEREQALLEQLERALTADDPGLASRLRGGRSHARARLAVALAVVVVGVAGVVAAAVVGNAALVIASAIVILAGGLAAVAILRSPVPANVRGVGAQRPAPARVGGRERSARVLPPAPRARTNRKFMARVEQRWESRRQGRRS